jgi:hypothetical protein
MIAVSADPHWLNLRSAVGHERREGREVGRVEKAADIEVEGNWHGRFGPY